MWQKSKATNKATMNWLYKTKLKSGLINKTTEHCYIRNNQAFLQSQNHKKPSNHTKIAAQLHLSSTTLLVTLTLQQKCFEMSGNGKGKIGRGIFLSRYNPSSQPKKKNKGTNKKSFTKYYIRSNKISNLEWHCSCNCQSRTNYNQILGAHPQ